MQTPFRTVRLRKHADYGLVYGASRKYQSTTLSFFYRVPPPLAASTDAIGAPSAAATDPLRRPVALSSSAPALLGEPSGSEAHPAPRFGITTPRALGPAVLRNRIKRRLRVAARTALPLLPPGVDVVLHPRAAVASMPFTALEAELAAVFTTVARRIAAGAPNTPVPRTPRRGKAPAKPGRQAPKPVGQAKAQ